MNGQAERTIQTIRTAAHTSLLASGLNTQYWDYAVLDATDKHSAIRPIGSTAFPAHTFHQHSTDQHDIQPQRFLPFGQHGLMRITLAIASLPPRFLLVQYLQSHPST
jgi:hypothetical protein